MAGSSASTPKKAKIQGVCDFLDHKAIPYSHNDVFKWAGVSKTTGWRILKEDRRLNARTFHSNFQETRGRKLKLSDDDVRVMERFIEENGFDSRSLRWEELPAAAGLNLDVCGETVRRRLKDINFRRCLECQKQYVSPRLAEQRVEYARTMVERYPQPEDWHQVRFSDEAHFG